MSKQPISNFGLPNIKGGAGIFSILLVPIASSFISAFPYFEKLLAENQFLAAGLALVLVTTFIDYIKLFFVRFKRWIYTWFCASVTLESKEEICQWCAEWFFNQGYASKAHFFTLKTITQTATSDPNMIPSNLRRDQKPNFLWAPLQGDPYYFKFQGTWISFEWKKGQQASNTGGNPLMGLLVEEHLEIIAWNGSREVLQNLITEVVEYRFQRHKTHTRVYTVNENNRWALAAVKDRRNISTVVLDSDVKREILDDIEHFIDSKQFYTDCGIPYRRGYLLYGPPGTGKTSFIFSLAGRLQMSISIFSLSGRDMSDANLLSLFQTIPTTSIVVLEDIDAIFLPQNKAKAVTFSGLLNALDGIASGEGRILFMTTNHYDRLSPTLIRPGRVDLRIRFDYASKYQIRLMIERFFPFTRPTPSPIPAPDPSSSSSATPSSAPSEITSSLNIDIEDVTGEPHPFTKTLMDEIGERVVSTAQLQDWFIKNLRHKPEQVLLADVSRFVTASIAENKSYETSWDMMMSMHEQPSQPPSQPPPL